MSELRVILRGLRTSWRATAAAVLCLACGTAAVAAMITLIRGALFAPLPFPQGDRLMRIWRHEPPTAARLDLSYPDIRFLRSEARSFDRLEATALAREVFLSPTGGRRVEGEAVTAGYFDLLGVRPVIGRLFREDEYQAGGRGVVLLSYSSAQNLFGSDQNAFQQQLRTQNGELTIVGVLPPSFGGTVENDAGEIEFWVPMDHYVDQDRRENAATRGIWAIGRRAPDVTPSQARAELDHLSGRIASVFPATHRQSTYAGEPFGENWRVDLRRGAWLVLGAALGVLLVAALNASALLLARALDRRREEAIRLALGATQARLVQRAFLETLVLVLAGGALGVVLAQPLVTLMLRQSTLTLPTYITLRPDALGIGCILLALSLIVLLAGISPALLSSRVRVRQTLEQDSRTATGSRQGMRLWSWIAVGQIATTVILIAGSLSLLRTWQAQLHADLGFRTRGLLRMSVFFSPDDARDGATLRVLQQRIRDAAATAPGVTSLGMLWPTVPLPRAPAVSVRWNGMPAEVADRGLQVGLFAADPSLFEVLQIRAVAGRVFAAGDDDRSAPVAIVSVSLAERLGAVQEGVGAEIRVGNETLRIVGVVNNVRFGGPFEDETQRYELYRPLAQMPRNVVSLFAEVPGEPGAYVPQLTRLIAQIAPTSAVDWVGPVDYWIREQLGGMRFLAVLTTLFGWACLVLAGLGIVGITAAGVASRTRELAIRQALGATAASLQMAFTGRAMRLAIAGVIIGAGGEAVLVRIVSSVAGDLRLSDPTTLTVAALVLVTATGAAAWLPARRVTHIQPAAALKD